MGIAWRLCASRLESRPSLALAAELDIVRRGKGIVAAIWALGVMLAVAGGAATLVTSQLIELEYTEFRDQWLADGRPVGGKRSRTETSFWRSDLSRRSVMQRWLLETPTWVRGHSRASQLLRTFRISAGAMFLSMLGLVLATAYLASH